jgi:predicted KAP-like P-loop ATPase
VHFIGHNINRVLGVHFVVFEEIGSELQQVVLLGFSNHQLHELRCMARQIGIQNIQNSSCTIDNMNIFHYDIQIQDMQTHSIMLCSHINSMLHHTISLRLSGASTFSVPRILRG